MALKIASWLIATVVVVPVAAEASRLSEFGTSRKHTKAQPISLASSKHKKLSESTCLK